ncbi:MAG TPA: peptidyl-alpha-hydroxyglycine alpha-amidating lyase family protein [Rhizomicrobium sp.]|nr:peptidyl-alpha-hydroxyglycine alpha-amidating lyase family protein [Rhizomicrobium sp.]
MKLRILFAVFAATPLVALAQPADQPHAQPNPATNRYVPVPGFFKLPPGRTMGSSSAVAGDSHGHLWVVDRCGANSCVDSKLDPIMEFDAKGRFIKAFGAGLLQFAHGFTIDSKDHLWITDGVPPDGKKGSRGQTVMEFDTNGKLLRTLGKPGVAASAPDGFTEPNAVLIAPDGSIFVAQGHTRDYKGQPRIIKFDANGRFIRQWGSSGTGPGQFGMPHCLAMDSKGNLYVGDRDNNRIQVFTQDGKLLGQLTQFGRPSGIAIDRNDVMYVTDSESKNRDGYGHHPGWKRGIRIGSLKDGEVTDFIPDTYPDPEGSGTSGGEGIWADGKGAVYSAQVEQKAVVKYIRR